MASLLTIPREIRDEIYGWALLDTLASSRSRDLQRERKRITYSPDDPETIFGEGSVRYPVHTSLPPTHALLHTTRQLRNEFLDTVKRLGKLKYKVDLIHREDKGILVPTWISIPCLPCFVNKVDELEVHWRPRGSKTSSVMSYVGYDQERWQPNGLSASLAMLQRFVERGIYLLSKKKRQKVHIGLLAIHLDLEVERDEEEVSLLARETGNFLNDWMVGDTDFAYDDNAREREDAQFRLLADKIDRIQLHVNGTLGREWELSEVTAKRDSERPRNAD
jgi:hypothetical protein